MFGAGLPGLSDRQLDYLGAGAVGADDACLDRMSWHAVCSSQLYAGRPRSGQFGRRSADDAAGCAADFRPLIGATIGESS